MKAPSRRRFARRWSEGVVSKSQRLPASKEAEVVEPDTDRLQELVTRLLRRWRDLPERRREDIFNRGWVYAFAVFVLVAGPLAFLGLRFGGTAALCVVTAMVMLGALGAFLAGRQGRSRVVWGVVCYLLPVIGLVVLSVIPDDAWRDPSARH
jgi:VIT1/CCC1 family predicted Fe2+/Mn2+ transporter